MKLKLITSLLLFGASLTAHAQYDTVGVYDSPTNPNVVDFDNSVGAFTYPVTVGFMPTIWGWNVGGTVDFDTATAPTAPTNSLWARYGISGNKVLQVSFVDQVRRIFRPYAISNFSALRSVNPMNMEAYYGPGLRACGFTVLSDPSTSFWAVVTFTRASGATVTAWNFIPVGATVGDTYFSAEGAAGDPIIKSRIQTFGMSSSGQLIIDDLSFLED